MSGHGGGHAEHGHDSHGHGAGNKFEFKDLLFPLSLFKVVSKNGFKDFLLEMGDMLWRTGVCAVTEIKDTLGELFGAGGGGHHGHSSHGHAAHAH